jgi:ribosomal 50S subunit-recycling heat shock protein
VRIDVFLKKTLAYKKRSQIKLLCEKELVKLNGRIAKPSKHVTAGDIIEIETVHGTQYYKILSIPHGNVRKNDTTLYYEACR